MVRIRYARVSSAISSFEEKFMMKYDFKSYKNRYRPTIFFGCYPAGRPDIKLVTEHRSLAVVVWAGSDALAAVETATSRYAPVLEATAASNTHLRHVAISQSTSGDLMKLGIPHTYLPITPTLFEGFTSVPLGPKVYTYSSHHHPQVYGMENVKKVFEQLPDIELITGYYSGPGSVPSFKVWEVYAQCFIGLRLTPHDGLSNTVVEMGLMGRRCVWNGWTGNAIPWRNVEGIVKAIRREQKKVGTLQVKVAEATKKSLVLPDYWQMVEFYQ